MDDFESVTALEAEAEDYDRENAKVLATLEAEYGAYATPADPGLPF